MAELLDNIFRQNGHTHSGPLPTPEQHTILHDLLGVSSGGASLADLAATVLDQPLIPLVPKAIPTPVAPLVPVATPVFVTPIADAIRAGTFRTGNLLNIAGGAIAVVPRLLQVLRAAAGLATAGGNSAFGGSKVRAALGVIGVASIVDFMISLFDDPDITNLADMVEELVESGWIQTPGTRRDGTETPLTWLHWNIANADAKPFLNGEYISRKFVAAVRRNERTPRYSAKPRPRGRRARGS